MIGFVKPTFPNEKRVAVLPEDLTIDAVFESGFGLNLDIDYTKYLEVAYARRLDVRSESREFIYKNCDWVFNLKLTQEEDYAMLREGQTLIGWTHPEGSGREFMKVAKRMNLKIVDLDNVRPQVYYKGKVYPVAFLPKNWIWRNSFNAGFASVVHAYASHGCIPGNVAILGSGNVSQGALYAATKLGSTPRMYYRRTLGEFFANIHQYDAIINGVEMTAGHLVFKNDLHKAKQNCLIIDAAADAGGAIEGTRYTTIDHPIYKERGLYFYVVNNAPSIFYRDASRDISLALKTHLFPNIDKL